MAKVVAPFFSQKASGSFANTLTIQCGSVMKKKIAEDVDPPLWADLNFQQKLFSQAAKLWKQTLSEDTKKQWRTAEMFASLKPVCLFVPVAMAVAALANPEGGIIFATQQLVILSGLLYAKNIYELKGYQLWMSVFLAMKGEHWVNYPNPPPETWRLFD